MKVQSNFASGVLCALLVVMVGACASPGPVERREARLERFEAAAGEPIDSFQFWRLYSWEALGSDRLAVWTRFDEAYLLQVDRVCWGLEFARAIGVTSTQNRVSRPFDAVTLDDQRCAITEIRPVDTVLLKQRTG